MPNIEHNTNKQVDDEDGFTWTTEARAKFKNIPYFVRSQARQRIEQLAQASGSDRITAELVDKAKIEFGQ